jgi:hypothetical protein|tara:strand:- start:760 stop:945 length:186 start_codon:yes stop_codon:yes gene_type:complete
MPELVDREKCETTLGGVKRYTVTTSFNKAEYECMKKLQAESPISALRNSTSAFIKHCIFDN